MFRLPRIGVQVDVLSRMTQQEFQELVAKPPLLDEGDAVVALVVGSWPFVWGETFGDNDFCFSYCFLVWFLVVALVLVEVAWVSRGSLSHCCVFFLFFPCFCLPAGGEQKRVKWQGNQTVAL